MAKKGKTKDESVVGTVSGKKRGPEDKPKDIYREFVVRCFCSGEENRIMRQLLLRVLPRGRWWLTDRVEIVLEAPLAEDVDKEAWKSFMAKLIASALVTTPTPTRPDPTKGLSQWIQDPLTFGRHWIQDPLTFEGQRHSRSRIR